MQDGRKEHAALGVIKKPCRDEGHGEGGQQKTCKRHPGLERPWNKREWQMPEPTQDAQNQARVEGAILGLQTGQGKAPPRGLFCEQEKEDLKQK